MPGRLVSNMAALRRQVRRESRGVINGEVPKGVALARALSPVGKTGNLRDSNKAVDDGDGFLMMVNDSPHAQFVNDGTIKMEARPFFSVAVAWTRAAIMRGMRRSFPGWK